jgi:signal transduction histidine kinase/DNA-binding response OmpR family regulator
LDKQKYTDWTYEAVNFLTGLYPIKKEKDFNAIYQKSTNLIKKHAQAKAAAFVMMEDKITVKTYFNTSEYFLKGFQNAELVLSHLENNQIVFDTDNSFPKEKGEEVVFIPLNELGFVGAVILLVNEECKHDELFIKFLDYALIGLKETAFIIQNHFLIEELSTRFNAILETIPQGIVFVDDVGKNGWVNSQASAILNIPKEKNKPIAIAEAMQKLRDTAANKEEIIKEGIRLFSVPGQKINHWKWIFGNPITSVLSVSCVPTISENIKGRLWVFTDVTFQHLANEQLQELNDELAEKRRIADDQNKAKSDFLANMSHEIRTPMNGVIGMASLLVNTQLDEEQLDYVETIRISGEALIAIINDILDFSKIESGKIELENKPLLINTVIEETYDLLSVNANAKGLDLLYYIDPNVPLEINGDITRLRQIMINLVNNGIKFTEKGEIQVSVRNAGLDEDGFYNIEFAVKDTGIGIPKDKYYRLFDSFSQVDSSTTRKYGGTGLGLAISQRLVTLMGGAIRVESEVGKGSSFIFNIKAEVNRSVKKYTSINNTNTETISLKNKRILILDDNKTNLKILKTQCSIWGMNGTTFEHYEEALLSIENEFYDLVIIDMLMPGKDGIEVTEMIKSIRKDLPVILFSSSGNHQLLSSSNNVQLFEAILNKPTRHSQILKAITEVLTKTKSTLTRIVENNDSIKPSLPINILIAEDDSINQKLLTRVLEKLGYIADIAENGLEVLKAMEQKTYHLIFMDVMMPEMDGFEATRIIVKNYPKNIRPIIITTTANALTDDREKAIIAGMNDYISKPFKIQDVKDKIDKWKDEILTKVK